VLIKVIFQCNIFNGIDVSIDLLVSIISLVPLPNIILLAAFTQVLTPSHKPHCFIGTYWKLFPCFVLDYFV